MSSGSSSPNRSNNSTFSHLLSDFALLSGRSDTGEAVNNTSGSQSSLGGYSTDRNGREIGQGKIIQRPELVMLKEIVPDLDTNILSEILFGNNYDLERSIDAALALNTSLTVEKGTTIVAEGAKTESNNSSERIPSRDSLQRRGSTGSIPSLLQSKSNRNSMNGSKPRLSRGASRGAALYLNLSFLSCPRFRIAVDRHQGSFTDFTIHFARHSEKLGITIKESEGEILIHNLHSNSSQKPCLALEAGVKIGDVLTGINGEYFSPGVEVQDVLDLLELAGRYVTMHFTRRHRIDDSMYHKCAQMLLDQGVIKSERAQYVTKVMYRLKERVLQWDNGWISQRIESWKLYKGVNISYKGNSSNFASQLESSSSSSANSLGASIGSTLTSSFFGSILQGTTTNTNTVSTTGSDVINDATGGRIRRQLWDPLMITNPREVVDDMSRERSGSNGRGSGTNDIVIATKNLRPALSIRLLRAEEKNDHYVYVVWVMDVKSGAEWTVKRRFREFHEFRELLVTIRPSISQLDFPPKRISVGEASGLVMERLNLIQKFLRRVLALVTLNSLHPSTARVQLALQHFLDVSDYWYAITVLEKRPNFMLKNIVQVYVHSVMQMTVMDKVLSSFLDNFFEEAAEEDRKGLTNVTEESSRRVLDKVREYIDNLQNVLYDGIYEDCFDIINKYRPISHPVDQSTPSTTTDNDTNNSESSSKLNDELRDLQEKLSEDEMRLFARSAIRKQIEIEIYIPCAARITSLLDMAFSANEHLIQSKMRVLRLYDQQYFGVAQRHTSPSSWDEIVTQMKQLRSKTLPHDRLESLVDVAKEIPILYRKEHPSEDKPLGADEFLPIFIYVLVQSEIPDILALNEELQAICDPDKRLSETGYYLATFEASLQHVMEYDTMNQGMNFFQSPDRISSAYERIHNHSFSMSTDSEDANNSHNTSRNIEQDYQTSTPQLSREVSDSSMTTPTILGIVDNQENQENTTDTEIVNVHVTEEINTDMINEQVSVNEAENLSPDEEVYASV